MNIYCQIDGAPGDCPEQKHKDWCSVLGYQQAISYPYSFKDGRGTGEPNVGGISITKLIDVASPLLAEACTKKKKINKVVFHFTRDNPKDGSTQVYYMVTLQDCRVIAVGHGMGGDAHTETVEFGYRKIVWRHEPANKETQFDLENPTA